MFHPDALFDQSVRTCERPDGNRSFESKTFDVPISVWIDGSVQPSICAQLVHDAVVFSGFVNLRYEQGPFSRRF